MVTLENVIAEKVGRISKEVSSLAKEVENRRPIGQLVDGTGNHSGTLPLINNYAGNYSDSLCNGMVNTCRPPSVTTESNTTINEIVTPSMPVANNNSRINILGLIGNEVPLPSFNDGNVSPQSFLKEMDAYFELRQIPTQYKMLILGRALKSKVKEWFELTVPQNCSYEEFKQMLLARYRGEAKRTIARNEVYNGRYPAKGNVTLSEHFLKIVGLTKLLDPTMPPSEVIQLTMRNFAPDICNLLIISRPQTYGQALR